VVRFDYARGAVASLAAMKRKDGAKTHRVPVPSKVMTVLEVSDYLRVHRSTIYRLLKQNQIPAFRIGSDWRFNVETIDRWRSQQGDQSVPVERVGR
jgi:excisionase family DNA binding protein